MDHCEHRLIYVYIADVGIYRSQPVPAFGAVTIIAVIAMATSVWCPLQECVYFAVRRMQLICRVHVFGVDCATMVIAQPSAEIVRAFTGWVKSNAVSFAFPTVVGCELEL